MAKSKAPKIFRRFIRISGRVKSSPEFTTKQAADDWYEAQKQRKKLIKRGVVAPDSPTFIQYTAVWIQERMANYGPETWKPDEQRLRKYLLPELADFKLESITRAKCRDVLLNVTREHGLSRATRTKVQALLSKIFNDALNNDPPLVSGNPVSRLIFSETRKGKKKPATLEDQDEITAFVRTALECGERHFILVCLALLAGLRKSEIAALRWRNVRWKAHQLKITSRYVQARRAVVDGTKAGEDETRDVPVAAALIDILKAWRERSPYNRETDFVLACEHGKNKGLHTDPRVMQDMVEEVRNKFGRTEIGLHSLRHTYGRAFIQKTGNQKALQMILGHASSQTTDIYSELSSKQVQPFAEAVTIDISDVSGITDTQMTRKKGTT